MILENKTLLITGILTDKSIAYASAKIAIENGATVVATGFGKGLRITERAVKRLSDDIKVFPMDIENQSEVDAAVDGVKQEVGNLDGILHAIAFSPTEAMGGNFRSLPKSRNRKCSKMIFCGNRGVRRKTGQIKTGSRHTHGKYIIF